MKKIFILLSILTALLKAEEIYATFIVEPLNKADLAFSIGGIVDSVKVDIGDEVKKGEILASLDNKDLKARLNVTKTKLKYAKKDYQRRIKVRDVIESSQLDRFASNYDVTKAEILYQQSIIDKTYLKAPFDGVITYKAIEVGDAVSGAMIRTVFKIQSTQKRKLILSFDQKYWSSVKVGDRFIYKLDGLKSTHEGIITKIYPSIDLKNSKIKAEVKAKGLMVGLFGDGKIITKTDR